MQRKAATASQLRPIRSVALYRLRIPYRMAPKRRWSSPQLSAFAAWLLSGSGSSPGSSDSGSPYSPFDEVRRLGECAPYLQPVRGGC